MKIVLSVVIIKIEWSTNGRENPDTISCFCLLAVVSPAEVTIIIFKLTNAVTDSFARGHTSLFPHIRELDF